MSRRAALLASFLPCWINVAPYIAPWLPHYVRLRAVISVSVAPFQVTDLYLTLSLIGEKKKKRFGFSLWLGIKVYLNLFYGLCHVRCALGTVFFPLVFCSDLLAVFVVGHVQLEINSNRNILPSNCHSSRIPVS